MKIVGAGNDGSCSDDGPSFFQWLYHKSPADNFHSIALRDIRRSNHDHGPVRQEFSLPNDPGTTAAYRSPDRSIIVLTEHPVKEVIDRFNYIGQWFDHNRIIDIIIHAILLAFCLTLS